MNDTNDTCDRLGCTREKYEGWNWCREHYQEWIQRAVSRRTMRLL